MIPTAVISETEVHSAGMQDIPGLVSVIMPAYNAAKYIEASVRCVFDQTYSSIEIIVVDDGSVDETAQVLAPYIADGRVRYFYQQNAGPAAARNLALRHVRGEFVAFQDSDDLWVQDKLEKQIAVLRNNPDVGLVYCDAEWFGEQWEEQRSQSRKLREYERRKTAYFRRGQIYSALLKFNFIPTMSVVVRHSILRQAGPFLEQICGQRFSYGEDFELWLRIAQLCNIEFSLEPLVKKRVHPAQITADKRDGYRQLCSLYRYLYSQKDCREKSVVVRKYLVNSMKRLVATALHL